MEKHIAESGLSSTTTNLLRNMGITEISQLKKHNIKTFASLCPVSYDIEQVINELNSLGYLCQPENEISICDIPMSKRLQNVLVRHNIFYLSQLSGYPKEKILKFRNMGESTMTELDNICQEHGIQIHSLSSIRNAFIECHFSNELLEMFLQNNIFCVDDLEKKSANDLYAICGQRYTLTMQTYYTLKKNGILLNDWQDKYIFEILSKSIADKLWRKYNISKMSQFSDCDRAQLKKITTMFPELAETLKILS